MSYQVIYIVKNKEKINTMITDKLGPKILNEEGESTQISPYDQLLSRIFKDEKIDTPDQVKEVVKNLKEFSFFTFHSKNVLCVYDIKHLKFDLDDYQVEHAKKLYNILINNMSALDISKMGTGKTFTASYLANKMKVRAVVICPASVISVWLNMRIKGVPIWHVITYDTLIGENQPFLTKITDKENNNVIYEPSEYLIRELNKEKVMFIFDEVHRTKNNSLTFKAVRAITKAMYEIKKKNYTLLMSGTVIDKKIGQHINILRILGIITMNSLAIYEPERKVLRLRGVNQLWEKCMKLDPLTADMILKKHDYWQRGNIEDITYDLFIEIIEKHMASKMSPPNSDIKLEIRNRYIAPRDPREKEELVYYISKFSSSKFFVRDLATGALSVDTRSLSGSLGILMELLVGIEFSKRHIFLREILKILEESENTKVVLACSFIKTIDFVFESLIKYDPIRMTGSIPKERRNAMLADFQEPSNKYRVLIGNLDVLSTGIDLDDKEGNFPRRVFVSPNYKTMILRQFMFRFKRKLTKSDTTIDMVYAKLDGLDESRLIDALVKKGRVMKEASQDLNEGEAYPEDYDFSEEYYETVL